MPAPSLDAPGTTAKRSWPWWAWILAGVGVLVVLNVASSLFFVVSEVGDQSNPAAGGPGTGGAGLDQPAAAASHRVFVEEPDPSKGSNTQEGLQAVGDAIAYWRTNGYDVRRETDPAASTMHLQFIREWGGPHLGQQYGGSGGLLQVGLGDSNCDSVWTPFHLSSLTWIAAHEIGHALGFDHSDDPDNLMYPTHEPVYGDWCRAWQKQDSIPTGSTQSYAFTLAQQAKVRYETADQDSGSFDVCLITESTWQSMLQGGSMQGWACHDDVEWANDSADLPAGSYRLAMRCQNYFDNCIVNHALYHWP